MIVAGSASPLLLSSAAGAYNLTNSLRFRSSASAYLNRTPAGAGNRQTWTWSGWIKRGSLATTGQTFFDAYTGTDDRTQIQFDNNQLRFLNQVSASVISDVRTTQVFRDPSAWYHIVIVLDTPQATSSNRIKLYVNGVQITALATATYQNQSTNTYINGANVHDFGRTGAYADEYFDGYLAEVNFIDGQALTPSSFGQTSTTTGVWIPKKYTGTYGTNGFYLPFTDNSALTTSSNVGLGKDFSGNANYWTTNNISITTGSTYDSMTDVPTLTSATTANYCVLNPLDKTTTNTLSNGNLRYAITDGQQGMVRATFGLPSTGKWYCEATKIAAGNLDAGIATRTASLNLYLGEDANGWGYFSADGVVYNNNAGIATGATLANGDVLGIAFNSDSGTLQFYKNGTLQTTTTGFTPSTVQYFFAAGSLSGDGDFNFGQQPWAYTPPSGFVGLNTFNLPTPTIGATASTQASAYMNNIIWTGNGTSTRTLTGLNFQPDFVWTKSRSNAYYHNLYDAVRGFGSAKSLHSNDTLAEGTLDLTYGYVSAATSTGFSVANGSTSGQYVNENGSTYVAWNWKANGAGSSNTAGSITSTVSANTTAGFSVVTYTGNGGTSATVGHGLGVAPSMIIIKVRSNAIRNWVVYHASLGSTRKIHLNLTDADEIENGSFGGLSPTSTTFGVGYAATNGSSETFVAYCFAQVAGYSAFGKYTGNGSTDGPFVYTGFRPKFVMLKNATTGATNWQINDSARDTYNVMDKRLAPSNSDAEATGFNFGDFTSNGFKIRQTDQTWNKNGDTYIYMAFAENPFKYANAR
jgi:hypothetical protein